MYALRKSPRYSITGTGTYATATEAALAYAQAVLAANAEATGLESRFAKHVVDHEDGACFDTDWVLHHRTGDPMAASSLASIGEVLEPRADFRMWTDQFSNLWSILK